MISSAHLLAQRYLEGDLNDLEREAFLQDIERDPRVAEILDQEAQLDLAIIDDAFAIEPPAHLRAAVLTSISRAQAPIEKRSLLLWASQLTLGLLFLVANVVRVGAPDALRSVTTASHGNGAPRQQAGVFPQASASTSRGHLPIAKALPVLSAHQPEREDVIVQRVHRVASDVVIPRPEIPSTSTSFITDLPVLSMSAAPDHFSGQVGGAGVSFRYELASTDDVRLFVESGLLSTPLQASVFVNGTSQISFQQSLLPFAAVGAEGTLAYVSMLDREIRGSIAIGMAATGPLAIADISTSLVQLGPTTIDAGLRFFGAYDLRRQTAPIMQSQPFVRVTMGL